MNIISEQILGIYARQKHQFLGFYEISNNLPMQTPDGIAAAVNQLICNGKLQLACNKSATLLFELIEQPGLTQIELDANAVLRVTSDKDILVDVVVLKADTGLTYPRLDDALGYLAGLGRATYVGGNHWSFFPGAEEDTTLGLEQKSPDDAVDRLLVRIEASLYYLTVQDLDPVAIALINLCLEQIEDFRG